MVNIQLCDGRDVFDKDIHK